VTRDRGSAAALAVAIAIAGTGCRQLLGIDDLGDTDDGGDRPDAMPGDTLWRIETRDDFSMQGAVLDRVAAIDRDVLEPEAYAYGALRTWGSNDVLFAPADATTWALLDAVPAASRSGFALTTLPADQVVRPGGIGLDSAETWTMWADGEIWLDAGVHALELGTDGYGLLEVGALGDPAVTRITADFTGGGNRSATFTAPAPGWYPIRVAMTNDYGAFFFDVTDDPPGLEGRGRVERAQLRVAVNDLAGALITATDRVLLSDPVASDLHEAPLVTDDWGLSTPSDLALADGDGFSLRWEGQFLVDVPGDYTFRAETDDGHRLWIDGAQVLEDWQQVAIANGVTAPMTLAAGWHDIAFQFTDGMASARASLAVESGPPQAPLGAIALDRLRPVTGGARVALARSLPGTPLDTSALFRIDAGPGATATDVIVGFVATHTNWNDVLIELVTPIGTVLTVHDPTADSSPDTQFHYREFPSTTGIVNGTWSIRYTDTTSGNTGTADMGSLAIYHGGGHPAIATTGTWTSEPHDLGASQTVQSVTWDGHFPAGTAIAIEIRTCDEATDCDASPWTAVAASGDMPATPPGRFAQLRATFTTDGAISPWLDWIDVIAR
jgi:hypothetical protein